VFTRKLRLSAKRIDGRETRPYAATKAPRMCGPCVNTYASVPLRINQVKSHAAPCPGIIPEHWPRRALALTAELRRVYTPI